MRGYFAIGVEKISKQLNVGNLVRSAHGFGASFVYTIGAAYADDETFADTSKATSHVPLYHWVTPDHMQLPSGCQLVGVELLDEAIELPSFRHPVCAAYVLGPERGSLSPAIQERCDHIVKIPTSFCVNVAMAGAITMYDRIVSLGGYPARPVAAGGPTEARPAHVHGGRFTRAKDTA